MKRVCIGNTTSFKYKTKNSVNMIQKIQKLLNLTEIYINYK